MGPPWASEPLVNPAQTLDIPTSLISLVNLHRTEALSPDEVHNNMNPLLKAEKESERQQQEADMTASPACPAEVREIQEGAFDMPGLFKDLGFRMLPAHPVYNHSRNLEPHC